MPGAAFCHFDVDGVPAWLIWFSVIAAHSDIVLFVKEYEEDFGLAQQREIEFTPDRIQKKVIEILQTCFDPEIPVNIYELGLVYKVDVDAAGAVTNAVVTPARRVINTPVPTDLWSFGATLYWMLEAKPPTDWAPNRIDRLGAVVDGLLRHDPAERLSAVRGLAPE